MPILSYFYHNEFPLAYLRSLQNFYSVFVMIDLKLERYKIYKEVNAERKYFHDTTRLIQD